MKSKKFTLLILPILFFLFILVGYLNYNYYKPYKNVLWIQNCFIKKDEYAKSINEQKIVFTSGSNTLYGINAKSIEENLGIPTVNSAIHAGLRTDYILYRAKNILASGDIIILPFEYQNLIWNGEIDKTQRDYLFTHDIEFFKNNKDLSNQIKAIYSISLLELAKSIFDRQRKLVEIDTKIGFNSKTLNRNGDETNKDGQKIDLSNRKPFEPPAKPYIETFGLKKIKEFSNWCIENNVKLYVTFPNSITHKEYFENNYLEYFDFLINYFKQNNIEVIGKPEDTLYPIEYFYDTNYHMNTFGSEIRTNEFIEKMKKLI